MSGFRRRRLLPSLLVALVTMTGCAAVPSPESGDATTGITQPADARPVLGRQTGSAPDTETSTNPSPADPGPDQPAPEFDPDGGYESWVLVALDRLGARAADEPSVSREVFCQDMTVYACSSLPAELPEGVMRMLDDFREPDGDLAAPQQLIYFTAVACLLLDEMEWNDAIVLLRDQSAVTYDMSAIGYPLVMLATPHAVTFLCPEHEAATREQMTAVMCAELSAEECDQFEANWPSA